MGKNNITKHAGGRPTKYIPDVIYPKITEYIESCGRKQTELPTVEGLAIHLDIVVDTVYQWVRKYPKFSESIKKIVTKQKNQLMNDGMYGGKDINQAMAIFLLKANHGLNDGASVPVQVNFFGNAVKRSNDFVEGEVE